MPHNRREGAGSPEARRVAALSEATLVRRATGRVPKVEVVGRSVEGMDEMFWATITQFRTDLAGVSRK